MSTEYPPIKFDIYDGNQLVHSEIIADQSIKIGKLSSSHIRLDDDGISRMHSMVEVHGEGVLRVGFDLHAVAEIECVSFAVGAVVCRGRWM